MSADIVEDVRAKAPAERLLEQSWAARSRRASTRELLSEAGAAVAFLATAVVLATTGGAARPVDRTAAIALVLAYAVVRTVRFPIGSGFAVPSYLVLAPMLLILPVRLVPLLVCAGLMLGNLGRWAVGRAPAEDILFSIPDAWHALGPVLVLCVVAPSHGVALAAAYVAAFAAGCLADLIASALREWLIGGIAPTLHARVVLAACLLDACFAPLGFGIGLVARRSLAGLLLLVPLWLLMVLADRDRTKRIAQAHERLEVLARERARLQAAVRRLGDAFAAQLDISALADVLLRSSVEALDADGGRLVLGDLAAPVQTGLADAAVDRLLSGAIAAAGSDVADAHGPAGWALVIPFVVPAGESAGALAVARCDRPFSEDEGELITGLARRAEGAAAEIVAHETLRRQAVTDPLTGLGNRRGLTEALEAELAVASQQRPLRLAIFDLDGFKAYNDTFGHPAGDALLVGLARRLREAVGTGGSAYRLGGDEFCVLLPAAGGDDERLVDLGALLTTDHPEVEIGASCGSALLPHEAGTAAEALSLADRRMYADKHHRRPVALDA